MALMHRWLKPFAAIVAICASATGPTQAAVAPLIGGNTIVLTSPRFVATAVSFKADDETGWDFLGSDEVHAVFVDFNPVRERVTGVYEDVDSGETHAFRAADTCIAPQPTCDHGASSLHFAVALWESDWSLSEWLTGCYPTALGIHPLYDGGICPGDDLIGRAELNLSQMQLVSMLPAVGNSVDQTVKPSGGSGSYQFTYRITRLPDVRRTIVIHDPVSLGITLTLSLDPPPSAGKVRLAWSGASTATVDIVRGAALVATTANDGDYLDHVSAGTYQYRVCDAGTTFCSPAVSITVP